MELYGKSALKAQLDSAAEKGRLSHALLFSGSAGSGRKTMARYAAKLFLCGAPPCENCTVCRSVENDCHPDIKFVKNACGGKYGIDGVRDALADIAVLPNNGGLKLYIFEDFDGVSDKIQNHLLKIIEEPAPFVKFVFTCESANAILETILSRVSVYEVPPAPLSECVRYLEDNGCGGEKARSLAELCGGSIGKCRELLDGAQDEGMAAAKRAAIGLARLNRLEVCAALSSRSGRAEFAELLPMLSEIIRCALSVSCGAAADGFAAKESKALAAVFSKEQLLAMLDAIFDVMDGLILNPNIALTAARLSAALF